MKSPLLTRLIDALRGTSRDKLDLHGRYHIEVFRSIPEDARAAIRELRRIPEDLLLTLRRLGYSLGEQVFDNIITLEGRNHILDTVFHGGAQIGTWYLAPFSGNVTPQASWTGATFSASATELTTYDEASRVEWNEGAAASGQSDNLSNKAVFSLNALSDIYGFGLSSASAKGATSGKLMSAGRLSSPRIGLSAGDVLNVGYAIQATSS